LRRCSGTSLTRGSCSVPTRSRWLVEDPMSVTYFAPGAKPEILRK
jgi:hypothetical protein